MGQFSRYFSSIFFILYFPRPPNQLMSKRDDKSSTLIYHYEAKEMTKRLFRDEFCKGHEFISIDGV